MPKKKSHASRPAIQEDPEPEDTPFSDFNEQADLEPDRCAQDPIRTASHRKKARNVPIQSFASESPPSDSASSETAGQLTKREAILSPGLPHFSHHNVRYQLEKSRPVNIREELIATEKVSDQYTPPSDNGLNDELYGKSPQLGAVPSAANSPPVEPDLPRQRTYSIKSPPLSPAPRYARPVSFAGGISAVPSHGTPSSFHGSPPPPHVPQQQFYPSGDLDLGFVQHSNAGVDKPTFCKTIDICKQVRNAVRGIVSGYDSRLSVSAFDGAKVVEIGSLTIADGLPVDAEVLTWSSGQDPFADFRPLLAVTLMRVVTSTNGYKQHKLSVSVYSLSRQKHLQELLSLPSLPEMTRTHGHYAVPAPFINHLTLVASGNHFIVASGKSGEVFVFHPVSAEPQSTFLCSAKLWTSIQNRQKRRDSSAHNLGQAEYGPGLTARVKPSDEVPILAVSQNWLALCPPAQSLPTLGAALGQDIMVSRQSGIEAASAGPRPAVNCSVDSPDADSLFSKLARGAAQEMVKAGKWLGEQGMQYWQSYWNKDDRVGITLPINHAQNPSALTNPVYGHFPPTHADSYQISGEPETVSLYDLATNEGCKSLTHSAFATFKPPHGCSYLTFSPNGLMLFTASKSGEFQYIWDLFETKFGWAGLMTEHEDGETSVPRVRQIARFDRVTSSIIIDVVWEVPDLTRLAILTKNKTIHLFDLPQTALRWPPLKNPKRARPLSAPPTQAADVQHDAMPTTGFLAAMNIAGRTQTMMAPLKGRTPSASGGISGVGQAGLGFAAATGVKSGKVVAAGLSKSLGAATEGFSRVRHAGENRLHIEGDQEAVAGRLFWLCDDARAGICLLDEEGLRLWQVRKSKSKESRYREVTVFDARKPVSYRMPMSYDHADWSFWKASPRVLRHSSSHPLSFAEIDTSAPFRPFHTDSRVSLFISPRDIPADPAKKSKMSSQSQAWVFGDDVICTKVNLQSVQVLDGDYENTDPTMYSEMSLSQTGACTGEHIVSTIRHKKKPGVIGPSTYQQPGDEATQEGFFEDDCDVLDFADDRV